MYVINNETGDMVLRQGDSFNYPLSGLPTDKNYTLYFAVRNQKRKIMNTEISYPLNGQSDIDFFVIGNWTDCLTVPGNKNSEIYYFDFKICDPLTGYENTLLLGNKEYNELNIMEVLPRGAEGLIEVPTEAPTEAPTNEPTDEPTDEPSDEPTDAP